MITISSYILVYQSIFWLAGLSCITGSPLKPHYYCPVARGDSSGSSSVKIINVDSTEGHKLRLQFSYPTNDFARKISFETTTPVIGDDSSEASANNTKDTVVSATDGLQQDIFCQWEFRSANQSQFLLLTFDKLSAPYSSDCADAYIAMQKYNAFESRWCGNRKKGKARQMTLFSRGSAKVSAFHSAQASTAIPTGFTVVVEIVDASMIQGGKNALRVLLG